MISIKAFGLGTALVAAASLLSKPVEAQEWPSKPVKVVVPFAAGGTTDRQGRIMADHLSKVFKQQFYIENRVGGGGALGAGQVARSDPDGYTLMMGGYGQHVMGPAINPNIGYDPIGDFSHIAMIGGETFVLAAHAALGVKSFKDLVALSKSRSEPINCGTPGAGSLGELMVAQFQRKAMFNVNHIPYRGGAPLLTDFFGNHVSLAALPASAIIQHVAAGTVVPLAVTSSERMPALKDTPTFAELGHPDVSGAIWVWLAGPKNLPAPIVARLNEEVRRFMKTPEVRQDFERQGLALMDADVAQLNAFIAAELKRWSAFVKETGIKPQ